jgi:NADH-quinone oxidoreductase subunit A
MLVFVLLLVEGLAWAWAKGVLTWALEKQGVGNRD